MVKKLAPFVSPHAPMGARVEVLNRGIIRLVDHMGGDLSVVRSARTSFDGQWRKAVPGQEGDDERLINFLWKNNHTTPFEAVTFTFEVIAPIFVFRQWHRHRTQSYNELSARYKELPEHFFIPDVATITRQSTRNKQGRHGTEIHPDGEAFAGLIAEAGRISFEYYKALLKDGCPRELARTVLPLGTYSHMFATMNLHNLFRFLTLRVDTHAQYEIRVYAEAMAALIRPIVPVCLKAWENDIRRIAK